MKINIALLSLFLSFLPSNNALAKSTPSPILLEQKQFSTLISQTMIVPIDVGVYEKNPNYGGFVGFESNLGVKDNHCNFLKQNKNYLYFADEESDIVNRIENFELPSTQKMFNFNENEIHQMVKDTGVQFKQKCLNVNMWPIVEIASLTNHYGNRSLSQNVEDKDKVLNWANQYSKFLLQENIIPVYKHYPFMLGDFGVRTYRRICKNLFINEECMVVKMQPQFKTYADEVLKSMPQNSFLMVGIYVYLDVQGNPNISLLNDEWIKGIGDNGFKGVVVSDDISQLEGEGIPSELFEERVIKGWKNVDLFMALYPSSKINTIKLILFKAYQKGFITMDEMNRKIEKIQKARTAAITDTTINLNN